MILGAVPVKVAPAGRSVARTKVRPFPYQPSKKKRRSRCAWHHLDVVDRHFDRLAEVIEPAAAAMAVYRGLYCAPVRWKLSAGALGAGSVRESALSAGDPHDPGLDRLQCPQLDPAHPTILQHDLGPLLGDAIDPNLGPFVHSDRVTAGLTFTTFVDTNGLHCMQGNWRLCWQARAIVTKPSRRSA